MAEDVDYERALEDALEVGEGGEQGLEPEEYDTTCSELLTSEEGIQYSETTLKYRHKKCKPN